MGAEFRNNIAIIVALDSANGIGYKNDLLVHIPGDLKRFKEITSGNTIVMGRKTLESLPKWPLPNRKNVVLTANTSLTFQGCTTLNSIESVLAETQNEQVFVIGGGEIYKTFLPYASKLYLTVVEKEFEADTFFPTIDSNEWVIESEEKYAAGEKAEFAFKYVNLVRK